MNEKKYIPLTPFKGWVLENFPFIEADFDAITNYELICKIVEYLNNVINSQNKVLEDMTVLNQKFNDLKAYVDDYFSDLNLQTEVDNKLDAMVLDGTLAEIINQEIFTELSNTVNEVKTDIGTMNDLTTIKKDTLVNAINSNNNNYIDELRYKYSNNYEYFDLPVNVEFFNHIRILKDKYKGNYNYIFNPEDYKLNGNVYYVDPDTTESSSTQTGAIDHPFNNIVKAYAVCSDNDTIMLKPGIYRRNNYGQAAADNIDKSLNFIVYGNKYDVLFTNSDLQSWSVNSTYSNVYQTTRSSLGNVIDIRGRKKGLFYKLKLVTSLELCSNTLNSYYYESNVVYINIGEEVTNDKVICNLQTGRPQLRLYPPSDANKQYYLENIVCLSGDYPIIGIQNNGQYKPFVVANNCEFNYSENTSQNAITVLGADTIFYKCKACYGYRDGFNYHSNAGALCNSIEIDCIGANNGLNDSNNNNNGSTTHDGNKILRINGIYFNNKGGNVTDVQTNTISINIQCVAYDSKSTGTTSKGDFINQQAGCQMWLYNCYSKGSSSYVNIYGVENTNIYVDNCSYDNAYSDGSININ